jgi:iron complex transport system substrate-binding protein
MTVLDETGTAINVTLPVERIVVFAKGWAEIVYALGCGDLIVGRCDSITFPPSIVEKTVARNVEGGVSANVNLEVLLELEPDLVLGTQREVSDSAVADKLRSAGIPLIGGNSANYSNIEAMITNCGQILNKEDKAADIIGWINQYTTLVADRLCGLSDTEKLSFIYETNKIGMAYGPSHPCSDLIVLAGGTNIIADVTLQTMTISSEYMLEQNPDVVIKQVSFLDAPNAVTPYQTEISDLIARTGWSELNAVKEGRIYASVNTVIQGMRYPIGLLYFAKCMYPDLFEDIDPNAIHEEMIERFFGVTPEGIYMYSYS